MRNPNGFGCVYKASGNRRKPYIARITTGWDEATGKQLFKNIGSFITKNATGTPTNFEPTQDWQPATKKYVDDSVKSVTPNGYITTIGDGKTTSYTIKHNLNTENVIVQCRLVSTQEQVFVSNKIVDKNTISIDFNVAPANNSVTVYIK